MDANIEKRIIAAVCCKIFLQEFAMKLCGKRRLEPEIFEKGTGKILPYWQLESINAKSHPLLSGFLCINNCGGYLLYQV